MTIQAQIDWAIGADAKGTELRPGLIESLLLPMHAVQQRIDDEASKYNVLCLGRRIGKSEYGKRRLTKRATTYHQDTGWFSPTYKMLEKTWRTLKADLAPIIAHSWEQQKRIEFIGGGAIDFWAFERTDIADKVRGQAYGEVFLDECAIVTGLEDTWERAISATLTDYDGDAWFASTPVRGSGFQALYNHTGDLWRSWQVPTPIMRGNDPTYPPEDIVGTNNPDGASVLSLQNRRRAMSAEAFAQEFLADFEASETDLVHVLDRERTIMDDPESWYSCKYRIVGIDPGGGDPTAIIPLGITQGVVRGHAEHMHQYGEFYRRGDVTVNMIAEYLTKLGPLDLVAVGETGGTILTESLVALGFPAVKAEMKRDEGIETMRWLYEVGQLTINPGCRESITEFGSYRWKKTRDTETGDRYATSTTADHHADAMDARRYAALTALKGLPSGWKSRKVVYA